MTKAITLIIIIGVTELILAFLFSLIAQFWYKKNGIDIKAVLKGLLERFFLTIALVNNQTSALTFFSALKLATRLKHQEPVDEHNKFNDYYLIGNLASVAVAIMYTNLYVHFDTIELFNRITH